MTVPVRGRLDYVTALPSAFALPVPDPGYPPDYVQAECAVGREHPGFRHGCPTCPAPGYQHPVLGWQPRPCACPHHTEGTPS